MKNRHITVITMCAVCIIALAVGLLVPVSEVTGERFLSDARQSYRSASLVVSARCEDNYTAADGSAVSRVRVKDVLAGSVLNNALLHVKGQLVPGGEYLLYLNSDRDVHYAEDQRAYVSVSAEHFVINGENVEYGGSSMALEEIRQDMAELNKTVTVHGGVYYYDSMETLRDASESIFIGRVLSVSQSRNTKFRSQEGGSTIEKTASAYTATVAVYGSVKGAMPYGSTIRIMNIPAAAGSMTDGLTLETVSKDTEDILPLQPDQTYLFFLAEDPDAKQDYTFPVNPIQGWVKLNNDMIECSPANGALAGYDTLPGLVADMRKGIR